MPTSNQLWDTYIGVFVSSVIILVFLTYQTILATTVSVFDTYDVPIDGKTYLNADFRITTDDAVYDQLVAGAIVSMIVYVIGIPLLAGFLLWRNHDRLHVREVIESYGFLFLGYEIGTKARVKRVVGARERAARRQQDLAREERLAVAAARSAARSAGADEDAAAEEAVAQLRAQRDAAGLSLSGASADIAVDGYFVDGIADTMVQEVEVADDDTRKTSTVGGGGAGRMAVIGQAREQR